MNFCARCFGNGNPNLLNCENVDTIIESNILKFIANIKIKIN